MSNHIRSLSPAAWLVGARLLALAVLSGAVQGCGAGSPALPQAGSEAGLHRALAQEFARLGIDPARVSSAAPSGRAGQVFDLAVAPTGQGQALLLSWTEYLSGDYDLNGEVNAADLVPLGREFGAQVSYRPASIAGGSGSWPAGDWWDTGSGQRNWYLARIDGDGNGELNQADIAPLARNWQARISAWCIYRQAGPDAPFELVANPVNPALPFTLWRSAGYPEGASAPAPQSPLRFYFELAEEPGLQYSYRVAPYDEGSASEGQAGNVATFAPGGPEPRLDGSADPPDLQLPLGASWRFDASDSQAGSGIAAYAWDADGDGEFEGQSGTQSWYEFSYAAAGSYRATLRVTDNAGLSNTVSRVVHVAPLEALRPSVWKVTMPDGVGLSTHLYPPAGPAPWPVLLIRTPYGKDPQVYAALAEAQNAAGYALVVQDMRGRYESEGGPALPLMGEDMLGPGDGVATMEWLRSQPWCDGRIGTSGGSMLGMTQLYTAPHVPEGLRAQFIGVAPASMYHEFAYVGGAFCQQTMEQWVATAGFDPQSLAIWREHPLYDEYWQQFNIAGSVADVETPGMHYGGWFDSFSQGTLDSWSLRQHSGGEGARGRQWLVMGPWGHGTESRLMQGELEFPPHALLPPDAPYSSFMDHFMLGADTGILERPYVCYYRMGAVDEPGAPGNDWRYAAD